FRTAWWARHYGALTPKRHRAWSNSPQIGILDRGRLTKAHRKGCIKSTNRKVKTDGKISYSGNRWLKGTQL
ncbi:unnamed protein product, partial [Durusdinium trenchii]